MRSLLSSQQAKYRRRHGANVDLADGGREEIDNVLMRHGNHGLPIDFNDAMIHPNAPALRDTTSQETADNAVLNTEA